MKPADHLSLRQRLPVWKHWYPDAAFWEPWHMAMLSHGGIGNAPPPVTVMADLYHPAVKQNNPASSLLLTFEKRTLLGHLPAQMRLERTVPESLLTECLDAEPRDLEAFWGDLRGHVEKHVTPDEQPHLDEAARAVRAEMRARGIDPDVAPEFFPNAVTGDVSYAALARNILALALAPSSPLRLRLYCARASFQPYGALSLNIDVPEEFLHSHRESGTREVTLGLNVAIADHVIIPEGDVFVPLLSEVVSFSTLYAPDRSTSSQSRWNGRSSRVILQ